jgi:hypothetical protein
MQAVFGSLVGGSFAGASAVAAGRFGGNSTRRKNISFHR